MRASRRVGIDRGVDRRAGQTAAERERARRLKRETKEHELKTEGSDREIGLADSRRRGARGPRRVGKAVQAHEPSGDAGKCTLAGEFEPARALRPWAGALAAPSKTELCTGILRHALRVYAMVRAAP